MVLHTDLNTENIDNNSAINVIGNLKKSKELLGKNEDEKKEKYEIDNKIFNQKIDHNVWISVLK